MQEACQPQYESPITIIMLNPYANKLELLQFGHGIEATGSSGRGAVNVDVYVPNHQFLFFPYVPQYTYDTTHTVLKPLPLIRPLFSAVSVQNISFNSQRLFSL